MKREWQRETENGGPEKESGCVIAPRESGICICRYRSPTVSPSRGEGEGERERATGPSSGPRTLPTPTHNDAEQPAITINNSILPCVTAGFLLAVEPRPLLPSRKSRTTVLPPLPLPARRFPLVQVALSPPPSLSLSLLLLLLLHLLLLCRHPPVFRFNRVTFRAEECAAYDRMHSRFRRCAAPPDNAPR